MEYVKLGNTGLDVSKICLGCMSFGDSEKWIHDWVLNEEDSRKIIKKALDLGINFFDTANIYSMGTSEEYLGRALKDYAKREEVVIATKIYNRMHEGPNGQGLSRKSIMHEVEASLERLGTDYIDLLYIHRWDYETPIEETMRALNDLVRAGKVHYIGASSMYTYQFQQAQNVAERNGWTKFVAMQNHYNLVYREEEREMNRYAKETGVALVPYSPLAAGRLAREWDAESERMKTDEVAKRKYDSTEGMDRQIIEEVGKVAEKHQATRAQIATAWLWEKGVVAPIVGITKGKYLR
jgi:Predicted oxidoreductases (related to aryl-alcohol dehydrogenases)